MISIRKVVLTAALLLTPVPVLAQTDTSTGATGKSGTTGTSSGGTDTSSTTNRSFDYGWLGLLGLLGLAGLRRPAPHVVTSDRSATLRS